MVNNYEELGKYYKYENTVPIKKINLHIFMSMDDVGFKIQTFKKSARRFFLTISKAPLDNMETATGACKI